LLKSPSLKFKHNKIVSRFSKKADIKFEPMQLGDIKESYADIKQSKKILGFEPTTNIDVGIKKFVERYKEYRTNK